VHFICPTKARLSVVCTRNVLPKYFERVDVASEGVMVCCWLSFLLVSLRCELSINDLAWHSPFGLVFATPKFYSGFFERALRSTTSLGTRLLSNVFGRSPTTPDIRPNTRGRYLQCQKRIDPRSGAVSAPNMSMPRQAKPRRANSIHSILRPKG
jgi:hypothetical protein